MARMTPTPSVVASFALAAVAAACAAQTTSTTTSTRSTTTAAEPFLVTPVQAAGFPGQATLDVRFRPGIPVPTEAELKEGFGVLWWRPAGPGSAATTDLQDVELLDHRAVLLVRLLGSRKDVGSDTIFGQFVDRLNALAAQTDGLSEADRLKQLQDVNAAIVRTDERQEKLVGLSRRFESLSADADVLRQQLDDKLRRQLALERSVQRMTVQARERRQEDAIAQELRKIVDVRERQFQQAKQMAANGQTAPADVDQKAVELSESKIRLAEREAALGRSGDGSPLGRQTDELTALAVETTMLNERLNEVRDRLSQWDPQKIRPEVLDTLPPEFRRPNSFPKFPMPLYEALKNQRRELLRQRLALVVAKASVPPPPATRPAE
jgi:hypothetical protein